MNLYLENVIYLLRPQQWLKNCFIFLPLFFGRHLFDWQYWETCIIAFWAYSFAASGIYCFNDIHDVELDRCHPKKCMRPIASGAISQKMGYVIMTISIVCSFMLIAFFGFSFCDNKLMLYGVISFYILMNYAYCVRLKHKAIVDVFIIAIGFVLRILIGGFATGIWLSEWIILMTFLLALFLAFAKRRDDVLIYTETGVKPRPNINKYNVEFLNQAIGIVASVTMVCYILFTVSDEVVNRLGSHYLYVTSVFVLAGIIRYLQVTLVDIESGSPTKVLMNDRFIQICILGWILVFCIILYA